MGFSPLTNYVQLTSDSQPRTADVDMFILHHAATTSLAAILALFQPGGRTVSANYAMGNDGTLVGTVDESRRAWTSASSYDNRAITIEVANLSTNGWTISEGSHEKLAELAADLNKRFGVPLDRDHILGHRELYQRYGASYPTACPGSMDIDRIVTRANEIASGKQEPKEEHDMARPEFLSNNIIFWPNGYMNSYDPQVYQALEGWFKRAPGYDWAYDTAQREVWAANKYMAKYIADNKNG